MSSRRTGLQSRMSRKIADNVSDSSDSDDDLLDILHDDKDDDFKPVKSQPGLYYKVNHYTLDLDKTVYYALHEVSNSGTC